MSDRRQKTILWAIIISESSHVFCCVLPTLLSVMSLFSAGAGSLSLLPQSVLDLHDFLHSYELPMIIVSGAILAFGWGLHWYSQKIDCHDTGCKHGPCDSSKSKTHLLLLGATILFAVNVTVYSVFHHDVDLPMSQNSDAVSHDGHDHH